MGLVGTKIRVGLSLIAVSNVRYKARLLSTSWDYFEHMALVHHDRLKESK